MESTSTSWLGLGTTPSRWFRIQTQMSKAGRGDGCAGIFIGLSELPPQNGEARWECQVIRINRMMEKGPPLLEREVMSLAVNRAKQLVERKGTTVAWAALPRDSLERSLLEVTVKDGQIVKVKVGNNSFPELVNPANLAARKLPACTGRFGLMNKFGSTTFTGCTYESVIGRNDK